MIIKVCGMRESQNISDVIAAGATHIGLIFYAKSPRRVTAVPEIAAEIKRVGVFVDADTAEIIDRINRYSLDMVQLHGCETPEAVSALRSTINSSTQRNIKIIKAISVSGEEDIHQCEGYGDSIDMLLFDTKCKSVGGSGKHFDWSILDHYRGTTPFLLSGGINPEDASRIAGFSHPMLAGVDLNSRFETAPGLKDASLLITFIKEVKQLKERFD